MSSWDFFVFGLDGFPELRVGQIVEVNDVVSQKVALFSITFGKLLPKQFLLQKNQKLFNGLQRGFGQFFL